MCNNAEKRQFIRFGVKFPAEIMGRTKGKAQMLFTRDISSSGAFLYTITPLKKGKKVKIEITLENATLKRLTGSQSHIQVHGTIIRCDSRGMAVQFNDHKIIPMKGFQQKAI